MAMTSNIRRSILVSGALPAPRFRYSPVVKAGPFVFVSGLIGLEPESGLLVGDGAYGQALQVLRNVRSLADEQGWSMSQLLLARVFCVGVEAAGDVNRAWDEVFEQMDPPARTFVGVAGLPLGALVEIEFQFVIGDGLAA